MGSLFSTGLLLSCGADQDTGSAGPQEPQRSATASGLEYRVLRQGDGKAHPAALDTVKVNYRGWLVDGTEFDKSTSPVSFVLTNVIRGWTEGLQLMTKGAKFEFKIPAELGYGNQPKDRIPPNSVLFFEVELLDIKSRQAPKGLPVFEIPADGEMQTDPSGIEFCFYKRGTGTQSPRIEDKVLTNFSWWTAKGVTIRSTKTLQKPLPFPVGQPTEGWSRALQMMKVGDHAKFKIPAKYGYGDVRPTQVPAMSGLIMEIELLEILDGPRFYAPSQSELKKTAGGTEYAVIRGGNPNKLPGEKDFFNVRYAAWTKDGKFIESSFTHGMTLAGKKGDFDIPFLNEIPPLMGEGATWVVVCEPEVQFPRTPRPKKEFNETCLWQLEMVKVLPAPVFMKPLPGQFTRRPSGLQFQVLKGISGKGQRVAPSQTAVTVLTAWLPNGKLVDTSIATPTGHRIMRMGSIPAGFREALQLMKVGETYRFIVPAALRKGERPNQRVPEGSDLIMSIELLGVK